MNGPERPIKLLLLEDNAGDVALVTAILEQNALHCDLHSVTTGEEFAAALKTEQFDLIISDFSMPSFDGFAALALRQEIAPEVPFVLFSGSLGEEQAVESLKKGATDYVIKHRPERLGPSVRRAIQEAEDRAERRRIADQLRKQDELFRRIGENAEDLVAVLDVEGRRVYNSPSYRKLFGDPELLLGTDSFEEIHPDDRERIRRIFRETAATGVGQRAEYRFLMKDGSARFIESQGSVMRDKEGTVENVVVISRDVTQRKQAEEAIAHRTGLAALNAEVSLALTHGGPSGEMLRRCAETLVTHLDAAFVRIWTLNEAENVLELQASAGMYTHLDGPHGRVPVGKYKIGLIAQERKPHLTNSVVGDPRVNDQDWAKREGMVAFAGYPPAVGRSRRGSDGPFLAAFAFGSDVGRAWIGG